MREKNEQVEQKPIEKPITKLADRNFFPDRISLIIFL